ncbi:MAG: YgjV family protein [Clostridia bacterium]|nr:YgjV family protein [Clostridia bacterium]
MELICQAIGILAMILSVTSFQLKTKKQIIVMQCMTGVVFAIHYFMLPGGAGIAGGVVNVIAILRNLVFYFNYKPIFKSKLWVVFFAIVMGTSAIVSRPEPISVFMCIAMVFNTLAVSADTPVGTRKMILISSPFAFVYNIVIFSVGGIANEALVEIITAITFFKEKALTKKDA